MNQNNRAEKATKIIAYTKVFREYTSANVISIADKLERDAEQAYVMGSSGAEAAIITIQEVARRHEEKEIGRRNQNTRVRTPDGISGFINASILIYFILIFGVLIALSLIIFQF